MQEDAAHDIDCRPLYIVHVKGHRGACSIAFEDPARALASVADLQRHGFSKVWITNATGNTLPLDDIRVLCGQ